MSRIIYKNIGELLRVFVLCFFAFIGVSVVIDFIAGKVISAQEIERILEGAIYGANIHFSQ